MYKIKRLSKVPIDLFLDKGIWIEIQNAKKKGFITVEFEENEFKDLMREKYIKIVDPNNSISSNIGWKEYNVFFIQKFVEEMIPVC